MNRDEKSAVVDEIAEQFAAAAAIFVVDYRGISVAQAAVLRERLREADARFRVVKNSLSERAADQAGIESIKPLLVGPTALTFVSGDPAAAAKTLNDTARELQLLEFRGGVLGDSALSADDVRSIARLPSRDVLYGQLVAVVAAPLTGLARGMNALIGGLALQLGAIRDMDPPVLIGADAPTPAAAPEAEPAAEVAPAADAETAAEPEASEAEPVTEPEAEAAPTDTDEIPAASDAATSDD
jgi:large subunit ribosomal protein L10